MIAGQNSLKRFSVLLVTVFLANWLLAPAVFQRHEHVWCADHEQFEHVDSHEHGNRKHLEPTHIFSSSTHAEPSFSALEANGRHKHEACQVLAQLNLQSNISDFGHDHGQNDVPEWTPVHFAGHTIPSISQLFQAPKNSPPVV